jgi:hypothetical protein
MLYNLLCETIFQAFLHVFFCILAFFTPGKQPYFRDQWGWPPSQHSTPLVSARDHWWTSDFANAFVSPGVNSRGELVPSHGASRRRLGDYILRIDINTIVILPTKGFSKMVNPRANGAKRRARVLIPPRQFTPGETKPLAKSKVHQLSRAWVTVRVSVSGHPHWSHNIADCHE